MGPLVAAGTYRAALSKRVDGVETPLGEPVTFTAKPLFEASLPSGDRVAQQTFRRDVAKLQRVVMGAVSAAGEARTRLQHVKKALDETPGAPAALGARARELEARLREIEMALNGDPVLQRRNEPTPPAITDRVQRVVGSQWYSTSDPPVVHRRNYEIAAEAFAPVLASLRALIETDLRALETQAEAAGAPWTPGRLPTWSRE
jgi:hypothetical protein